MPRIVVMPDEISRLLSLEGWNCRPSVHGWFWSIGSGQTYRTTTVPYGRKPIPAPILGLMLSPSQTGWGRAGLRKRLAMLRGKPIRS